MQQVSCAAILKKRFYKNKSSRRILEVICFLGLCFLEPLPSLPQPSCPGPILTLLPLNQYCAERYQLVNVILYLDCGL